MRTVQTQINLSIEVVVVQTVCVKLKIKEIPIYVSYFSMKPYIVGTH